MTSEPIETDAKGIPLKGNIYPEKPSVPVLYCVMYTILTTIGYLVARLVCYRGSQVASADTKMALLASYDLGWLYAGIFLLRMAQLPLNMLLGTARKESKIGLPDQHVYRVRGAEGSKLGYVFMETDDEALGRFNRAQRALQNFYEIFPTVALQYAAASFVFPFPAFVCICLWAVARTIQAVNYVESTQERTKGSILGVLAMTTNEGMVLLVAINTLLRQQN